VVPVVLLVTCGGLTHLTVAQSATAMIPAATILEQLAGDVGFGSLVSFDIAQAQELKNQGVKRSQIDSVKLTSLTLEITAPANGQDFTFLDSIAFLVDAAGQPQKQVAHGGPFAQGAKSITLTLDDLELAPYAAAPSMTFTTAVKGRRPANATTIDAKVTLGVDVNVGGLICGGK
jgi:hypothetical protein